MGRLIYDHMQSDHGVLDGTVASVKRLSQNQLFKCEIMHSVAFSRFNPAGS